MQIGLFATFMSPRATPDFIADFARRCEDTGVDSLWMGEHVVLFEETENPYPGSRDGKLPVPQGGGLLDVVATFGFMASITQRLRFGTGIALISQRNPVYTAAEFATLDWLTRGRIDFGIGVGWCKEEVLACGYSWHDRGRRSDEFLELITKLWTEEEVSYSGEHFQVERARMDPKPVQSPHIPIIGGGHSKAALRRAARFGAGWYGFALPPEQVAEISSELDEALAEAGRSRDDFELIITPPSVRSDDVLAYRDLSVDRLVLHLGSQKEESVKRRLDEIGEHIQLVG